MSEFARQLQASESVEDTLQEMTASAVASIPGAECAGISLIQARQQFEVRGATDPLVEKIDMAQIEAGEGPCLTALWDHHIVAMHDAADEDRWPIWRERIADTGLRSMLCFQLYVRDQNLAALNLYSRRPAAFGDESERVGQIFAAHAAVALAASQRDEHLRRALDSRDMIGMAKGILIERFKITPDQAFQMLVHGSQNSNIKLNQLADLVVGTGQPPEQAAQRETTPEAASNTELGRGSPQITPDPRPTLRFP